MTDVTRRQFLLWSTTGVATTWAGSALVRPEGTPLRLGVQGLGASGRRSLDRLLKLSSVEVAALCEPRADRLARAVNSAGSRACDPIALRDPGHLRGADLDALVGTVPPAERLGALDAACRAGRHVLVEPLPRTPIGELAPIVELAEGHGLLVAQRRHWQIAGEARQVGALVEDARYGAGVTVSLEIGGTPLTLPKFTAAFAGKAPELIDFARTVLDAAPVERVMALRGRSRQGAERLDARILFADDRWLHCVAHAGASRSAAVLSIHEAAAHYQFRACPADDRIGEDDLQTWIQSIRDRRITTPYTLALPVAAVRDSRDLLDRMESALEQKGHRAWQRTTITS